MKSYIICSQPRSGTHLLRSLLKGLNLGNPIELLAYVHAPNPESEFYMKDLDSIYETCSKDGIWGATFHWIQFKNGMKGLRELTGIKDLNNFDLLSRLFPDVQFIYLYRMNKIKQAVSLIKAKQSRQYRITGRVEEWNPEYEPGRIRQAIIDYTFWEVGWQKFFIDYNITPHFVTYESLCEDMGTVMSGILDFLGIEFSQNTSFAEQIREIKLSPRLWNHVNESWYEKFIGEQDWI